MLRSLEQLRVKANDRRIVRVSGLGQRQPERRHILRVEPRAYGIQALECPHQQPRARERDQSERDLRRDERAPYALLPPTRRATAPALAERLRQMDMAEPKRRNHAADDRDEC